MKKLSGADKRRLHQVKGNYETVGVSAEVKLGDCAAQQVRTWYLHTWCKNGTKWNVQADISSAIFRWIFLFHKMDRRWQKTGSPACWPGHKRKARLLVLSQPTGLKKQQKKCLNLVAVWPERARRVRMHMLRTETGRMMRWSSNSSTFTRASLMFYIEVIHE